MEVMIDRDELVRALQNEHQRKIQSWFGAGELKGAAVPAEVSTTTIRVDTRLRFEAGAEVLCDVARTGEVRDVPILVLRHLVAALPHPTVQLTSTIDLAKADGVFSGGLRLRSGQVEVLISGMVVVRGAA